MDGQTVPGAVPKEGTVAAASNPPVTQKPLEKPETTGESPAHIKHVEDGVLAGLTVEHRNYLLERHGTLNLDPLPSADPADPFNWPSWKKTTNLVLVAFHAMMTTFIASGVIPAYQTFAEMFGKSIQDASYYTSVQILILGVSPFFWKPISNRFGRRPIFLISTLCAGICNIGCAESHSYGAMMVCRILVSFFISPPLAIGSGIVTETFFKKERGQKMGIWTSMVTLGPPTGPFIMGFVAYHVGWKWIYWIFAIINFVQFILYIFLGPETRYLSSHPAHTTPFKAEYLTFRRIDPTPLTAFDFYQPLLLARYSTIVIPAIAYSIVFGFTSVMLTVEIPQLFGPKFGFNAQEIGLQFLGMIIGTIIGEQLGGSLSDLFMNNRAKRLPPGQRVKPEYRLWISYFGYACTIIGLVVFCVQLDKASLDHWNVTPIVGIGIAAFGNQVITTVLVTYAVDSHHEHSASIGVFITLVRQLWGFIGPFWFPDMFSSIGLRGSAGLCCGLILVFSILPTIFLQLVGGRRREKAIGRVKSSGA